MRETKVGCTTCSINCPRISNILNFNIMREKFRVKCRARKSLKRSIEKSLRKQLPSISLLCPISLISCTINSWSKEKRPTPFMMKCTRNSRLQALPLDSCLLSRHIYLLMININFRKNRHSQMLDLQ